MKGEGSGSGKGTEPRKRHLDDKKDTRQHVRLRRNFGSTNLKDLSSLDGNQSIAEALENIGSEAEASATSPKATDAAKASSRAHNPTKEPEK